MTTTIILEQCRITPSSAGAATELLLPLLYSDIVFLPLPLPEQVIFYSFQCSESNFFETIVPKLKNSLSLTLKHFPPLAGNIIFPLTSSGMPVSHYVAGDAISLTVALSKADLIPLTGNHPRDADQFHDFVPDLPTAAYSSDSIKFPVAAIQVTLFPNQGISIGITHHHAVADGSTIIRFINSWASITKLNGDDTHLLLPSFDRSGVSHDADSLTTSCWNHMKMCKPTLSSTNSLPTYKVRATFILSDSEIRKLKNFVMSKKASMALVSNFSVVCALVWTSLARSAAGAGEVVAHDEPEYFTCVADCRRRLNPPLPDTYFGNCLALVLGKSTHETLIGDEGIVIAAEVINEAIKKSLNNNNKKYFYDCDQSTLLLELERIKLNGNRMLGIIGSPRLDIYGANYGWGRPKSYETIYTDCSGSVLICPSRSEYEGGIEIGLSMTKLKMDAFGVSFNYLIGEALVPQTYNNNFFSRL